MAAFRIDQATPGAGVSGRARHDLVEGEEITLVATAPVGGGVTYTWEIIDKVGSAATLSGPSGASVTLGPGNTITPPCSFLVQLTAQDGDTQTVTRRPMSVRSRNARLRVPLFGEEAPRANRLESNDPDASVDNAYYLDRAGLGVDEQNWRGWAEGYYEMVRSIERTASFSQVPLSAEHTGVTERVVGSIYLPETVLSVRSSALFGIVAGAGEAQLRLRRHADTTLVFTLVRASGFGPVALSAPTAVPAEDWYDITLSSDDAGTSCFVSGLYLDWS